MKTHTTEALADALHVRPNTIRSAYCRDGHYFGFRPFKQANGRLAWPDESLESLVRGEVGPAAAPAAALAA